MQETGFIGLSATIIGAWLVFFLAACFVPAITFCHVLAYKKGPLHAHLARQLGALQLWLAVVQAALLAVLAVAVPFVPGFFNLPFELNAALLAPALVFCGTLLAIAVPVGGKNLRKRPGLLSSLTFMETACFWSALVLFGQVLVAVLSVSSSPLATLFDSATALPIPWLPDGLSLPARFEFTGLIWLTGPALAGGISLGWLLVRRQKDDFGRDYYIFAARSCASFAAGGGLLTILTGTAFSGMLISLFALPMGYQLLVPGWLASAGDLLYALLGPETLAKLGLTAVLPSLGLLCLSLPVLGGLVAFLWFLAARGAVPMRYKGVILLSFFLTIAAVILCSLLFGLAQTLPLTTHS